jgi:integrase
MLNDTKIKNFKPKPKKYLIADSEGLSIEVNTKGVKHWRYRYRFNQKQQIISLGKYPIVGLAKARAERDFYKSLLLDNINPAQYKKDKKTELKEIEQQSKTFKYYFDEWINNNADSWSDNYIKEIHKRANKHLLPYIGNKAIGDIKTPFIIEVLRKIESLGKIETLHKVKNIASQIFSYCVGIGVIEYNPAREISTKIFKTKVVKNYATFTDPKKIGALLNNIDSYYGSFQITQALKLAPFVFLRPKELSNLKWDWIDWEQEQIKIPAGIMKMKRPHIVPLVKQTIEILKVTQQLEANSPFVFFSNKSPKTRPITPESLRSALRTMGYGNDEITTHGFRGMASTILHEQGYNSDYIERQLAHSEKNKVKGAYNHAEHLPKRREMMRDWADYLEILKNKKL